MNTSAPSDWLLYCRPGFERDCAEETGLQVIEAQPNSGFIIVRGKLRVPFAQLVFARQRIRLVSKAEALPERDRLTPLLAALPDAPTAFSDLWLEVPDTNEGKTLSGFTKRFQLLLEARLHETERLVNNSPAPRLHIFFPDKTRALIGISDLRDSAAWPMGILRLRMPVDAPSRSTLKLAEAFETLLSEEERKQWLRSGMTAVDLGAAPGGWTWQLVMHGLKVQAVDNGPMKGSMALHPMVQHLRQDGFRYQPRRPVDWVVCDMVEQPSRVAALMARWIASGMAQHTLFNLKLPMKKRLEALEQAFDDIRNQMESAHIRYRLAAKQLYHDREEVTVLLTKIKKR
ncbi:MAG: 23S rRNA (cytidine(2498)-2'-O)-methyltransferase RlmM [Pseudomonadota bacterium]